MISFAFSLWSLHYVKPSKQGCIEIPLNPPSTLTLRSGSLISAQPCSSSFTLYCTLHGACYLNIIPFNLFTSFCLVTMLMIWTWHINSPFSHHLQVECTWIVIVDFLFSKFLYFFPCQYLARVRQVILIHSLFAFGSLYIQF
jgi:hypothetical protein